MILSRIFIFVVIASAVLPEMATGRQIGDFWSFLGDKISERNLFTKWRLFARKFINWWRFFCKPYLANGDFSRKKWRFFKNCSGNTGHSQQPIIVYEVSWLNFYNVRRYYSHHVPYYLWRKSRNTGSIPFEPEPGSGSFAEYKQSWSKKWGH